MATPLDLGLLSHFSVIFPILLVYAMILGVLSYTKLLGDHPAINNIIAIVIALSTGLSPMVVSILNTMTPWLVLFFIFFLFLLMAYKFLGATEGDIHHVLTKDKTIVVWVIILFFVILLASIGKLYFAETSTALSGEGGMAVKEGDAAGVGATAFWATLFNPKVIGVIMVMLIAVFAIILLSKEEIIS